MATNEKAQRSTDVETHPLVLTDWMDAGDTLSSVTVSSVTPTTSPPLSVAPLDYVNYTLATATKPVVRATGGVTGNRYTVALLIETTGSRKKTEVIYWTIKD
jgi:hypothetical protein|tara:strand:+ start:107 stop:412 length:306 start_codon:yes stop_codon:yes gene_type:complete